MYYTFRGDFYSDIYTFRGDFCCNVTLFGATLQMFVQIINVF